MKRILIALAMTIPLLMVTYWVTNWAMDDIRPESMLNPEQVRFRRELLAAKPWRPLVSGSIAIILAVGGIMLCVYTIRKIPTHPS